jgi:hypothetical protein
MMNALKGIGKQIVNLVVNFNLFLGFSYSIKWRNWMNRQKLAKMRKN